MARLDVRGPDLGECEAHPEIGVSRSTLCAADVSSARPVDCARQVFNLPVLSEFAELASLRKKSAVNGRHSGRDPESIGEDMWAADLPVCPFERNSPNPVPVSPAKGGQALLCRSALGLTPWCVETTPPT